MQSVLQALGQSHPPYANADPAEHEKGAKPVQAGSIIEMNTSNFPCAVWIS